MNDIQTLHNEWKSLLPIDKVAQDSINRKFMLEFNYNSNHIEGNTLTYGQTELLLLFGQVDSDAKMSDLEDMKAHNVCLKMIQTEAEADGRPLTEYFIRTLHQTLLREDYTATKQDKDGNVTTYTIHAGCYKTRPNSVITPTGEKFEYATPEETPALMADLVKWYNEAASSGIFSAIELASLFHYKYIRIHPFEDGNGRIARLLVNYILLRLDYPMIVVRSDDKDRYLAVLNKCDISVGVSPNDGASAKLEQIQPFVEYLSSCLVRALTLRIRAAKGESIDEDDDWKKQIAISANIRRTKPARTLEYTTLAIRNAFVPAVKFLISELQICNNVCFSLTYSVRTGANYQQSHQIEDFYSFAERNRFQYHVKFCIDIKIAEFLPKYNINAFLECTFGEFGYEFKLIRSVRESETLKFRYGMCPSQRQLNQLSRYIGEYILGQYTNYCEENDN